MDISTGILVVIILIVLVILLALILLALNETQYTGGGNTSVDPRAKTLLIEYARKAFVGRLKAKDRRPFLQTLDQATRECGASHKCSAIQKTRCSQLFRKLHRFVARAPPIARLAKRTAIRAGRRVEDIEEWISEKDGPYLDIGCGDGSITEAVKEKLEISKAVCIETGKRPARFPSGVEYVRVPIPTKQLPFKDNEFGLVSAFMAFHHLEESLESILHELKRVCRPGALLIIREHDLEAGNIPPHVVAQYLDWVHVLYALEEGNEPAIESSDYRTPKEWTQVLESVGFELVEGPKHKDDLVYSYYAAYRLRKTK